MDAIIDEIRKKILESITQKTSDWKEKVYDSQQYQQELRYISDITKDFIDAIRTINIYSTSAGDVYDNFFCIKATDDLIQSVLAIEMMVNNGIHNTVKRELRYLIEMITKYVIVDYDKMGEDMEVKLQYLRDNIPNSSIEIIAEYSTPFQEPLSSNFKSEVKDFFYKSCAYVHPSQKQLDEQISNYNNGNSIGFESAKMLSNMNKTIFRCYDLILTMCFHSFGQSMSKDLFEQIFNDNKKWKYHKGKYTKELKNTLS